MHIGGVSYGQSGGQSKGEPRSKGVFEQRLGGGVNTFEQPSGGGVNTCSTALGRGVNTSVLTVFQR